MNIMTANKTAKIQFYEGTDEPVVPEIRLTRVRMVPPANIIFVRKTSGIIFNYRW